MVHDTLSEGLNQNVDFDVVFDRVLMLIAEVASSHNTTVHPTSTGSFGTLPSEYATPLALALTELVTTGVECERDIGEVEVGVDIEVVSKPLAGPIERDSVACREHQQLSARGFAACGLCRRFLEYCERVGAANAE